MTHVSFLGGSFDGKVFGSLLNVEYSTVHIHPRDPTSSLHDSCIYLHLWGYYLEGLLYDNVV